MYFPFSIRKNGRKRSAHSRRRIIQRFPNKWGAVQCRPPPRTKSSVEYHLCGKNFVTLGCCDDWRSDEKRIIYDIFFGKKSIEM